MTTCYVISSKTFCFNFSFDPTPVSEYSLQSPQSHNNNNYFQVALWLPQLGQQVGCKRNRGQRRIEHQARSPFSCFWFYLSILQAVFYNKMLTLCKAGLPTMGANMVAMIGEGVRWVTSSYLILPHLIWFLVSFKSHLINLPNLEGGVGGRPKDRTIQGLLYQPGQVISIIYSLWNKTFV